MPEPAAMADKLKVFISYSRDDLRFADQLGAALDATGFESLIDRHGISGAEDWKKRLGDLIRDADTVVFVLSPSSAKSDICAWEVDEAARLKKRIIPVLCKPLEDAAPPEQLATLNYIFFYEEPKSPGSGFGGGLARLVPALNTDLEWVREHTRLLARATEWNANGRAPNRLLFGSVIADAKAWAARRPKDAPEPTALHLDYIRASEEAEKTRTDEARKQVEERAKVIDEREQAFAKAATAQRLRNYLLATMTIVAALAGWQWWRAFEQEAIVKQRLVGAQYISSVVMLSGVSASVEGVENGVFRPLLDADYEYFFDRGTKSFPEMASAISEKMRVDPTSLQNELDSIKLNSGNSREFMAHVFDCMFKVYLGDDYLRRGDLKSARESYEKANNLITAVKVDSVSANSLAILKAQTYGRLGYVLMKVRDVKGARAAYEAGKQIVDSAGFEPEQKWFEARLVELDRTESMPTLAAPSQSPTKSLSAPATPPP